MKDLCRIIDRERGRERGMIFSTIRHAFRGTPTELDWEMRGWKEAVDLKEGAINEKIKAA